MLMIDSFYKELNIQVPASRDYVLDELPSTEEEIIAGRKIWNGVSFLGEYATEKNFLEMAGQYRILHLSTYGFSDRGRDGFSFLAFAEVADSIENELVFIRDLYSLKLDADLVVLSVCETGIEESKEGEGIVGITKALTFSGVKSIVAGLWKVGDISTSELFKKFYHQLKRGNTKEKAIQNAKLKYLKKIKGEKAHPFYWAGFIGIGDMREILFD
jgi:CHAT domain-containing protein